MSVWDDPAIKANDDYVKFENPGDKVVGTILDISVHTFPDGKKAPKLVIREDDGDERVLTAGQTMLLRRLGELRPDVGDRIAVVFERVERRDGGKTMKHFQVEVARQGAPAGDTVAAPAALAASGVSASNLL